MSKIDYKEIINPFIIFPLILLILSITGLRSMDLIVYSFNIFFFFSFLNNVILVLRKIVSNHFYLFVYIELFFSLIFLIPLFYIINLKSPILISFFILGLTDFIIQAYYNILPRKNGKEVAKLLKNKLIKSERIIFHPISAQKYIFKDFTAEIIEPTKINPSFNLINHEAFLLKMLKIPTTLLKHHYGYNKVVAFHLYLNKKQINIIKTSAIEENKFDKQLKFKLFKDINLVSKLKKINKKIYSNITTSYIWRKKCKIVFKKNFVLNNPLKIYSFLKEFLDSLKTK